VTVSQPGLSVHASRYWCRLKKRDGFSPIYLIGFTFFNNGFKNDPTFRVISFYSVGHSKLIVVCFNSGFNSDLKVSSLYNTGHNKCKELLPTKTSIKVDKNPTWLGSWMLLDALFTKEKGMLTGP
jgi:hypothetical protein